MGLDLAVDPLDVHLTMGNCPFTDQALAQELLAYYAGLEGTVIPVHRLVSTQGRAQSVPLHDGFQNMLSLECMCTLIAAKVEKEFALLCKLHWL